MNVVVLLLLLTTTAAVNSLSTADQDAGVPATVTTTNPAAAIGDSPNPEHGRVGHDSPVSLGFAHAFVASLSFIIVSELGDKTFFIAVILAMRYSRVTVFTGAITALALMTILGVLFGHAATVIPLAYTYYVSTALFAFFGVKMLREGYAMSPTVGRDELEEVQADLRRKDDENENNKKDSLPATEKDDKSPIVESIRVQQTEVADLKDADIEQQASRKSKSLLMVSKNLIEAFTMTFLAEWGDRSQITTIILATRENAYGVALGGVLGHALCTGIAVIGGRFIAQQISVRTVTIIGGVVFLMFALTALMFDPNGGQT